MLIRGDERVDGVLWGLEVGGFVVGVCFLERDSVEVIAFLHVLPGEGVEVGCVVVHLC